MISWNLLLSGRTLSQQAYAVLSRIMQTAEDANQKNALKSADFVVDAAGNSESN
ncbi:MAG: hypothetical protein PWR01_3928 [Clostridiales bacterium]|jgi:3-hydroxyacyl-CoA dehydrogenase|nr:hypothetical protein [Clostridiales bacterium]MDN5282855.1 hypothetical protein [Candidatus Ozemobacter sp.]